MIPIGSKNVLNPALTHINSYMEMPIDKTKAIIRILNSGSSKPPKSPTINIRAVESAIIPGIDQMMLPILLHSDAATIPDSIKSANIENAIQCVHVSFRTSHIVSFSGGVSILTPYLLRLSSTWASVKPV